MSEIMEDPDDETWVDLTEDEDEIEIEEEDNSSDDDDDDDSSNEDELEEVSDRVKSRIEAMRQEALRERQAREALAKNAKDVEGLADRLRKENEHLKKAYSEGEKVYIEQARNRVDAAIAAAKKDYKAAFETGDSDAVAEIQVAIADLMTQRNEIERYQPSRFDAPPQIPRAPQPQPQRPVDHRAQEWAQKNTWYGRDEAMSAVAMATHRKLVNEGVHPVQHADRYYKEIDSEIRKRFPEKFGDRKPRSSAGVAPVRQITGDRKQTRVKLTESQVTLARRLGLTPQQYASQLIKEARDE